MNLSTHTNTGQESGVLALLDADIIQGFLAKQGVNQGYRIDVLQSITSTNDYLAGLGGLEPGEIVVCVAEHQTRGKGRFGHHWWSPPGVNLYLSIRWPAQPWRTQDETLGLWMLVAFARLLETLGVEGIRLKWPNDICSESGKLGGILIERVPGSRSGCLVIGVGLNIAMSWTGDFQAQPGWTDLVSLQPGWKICKNELAAHVIRTLTVMLARFDRSSLGNIEHAWNPYDLMRDRKAGFIFQDQDMSGVVQGIDEQGRIMIRVEGETLHLHSTHVHDIRL